MRRLNWKDFLVRLSITFVLIWAAVSVFVFWSQLNVADYHYSGFPSKYSEGGGMCIGGPCASSFYPANLALDIAAWMAVSAAMVLLSYRIIR